MEKKRTLQSLQPPRHLRKENPAVPAASVRDGGVGRRDGETQRKIERGSRRVCPRTGSSLLNPKP